MGGRRESLAIVRIPLSSGPWQSRERRTSCRQARVAGNLGDAIFRKTWRSLWHMATWTRSEDGSVSGDAGNIVHADDQHQREQRDQAADVDSCFNSLIDRSSAC